MKIIITGGAGFIGSNLVEYLLTKNYQVIIIDDLSSGKFSNISSFINKVTFINKKLDSIDLFSFEGIDALIHLSAQVSVPLSISDFKRSSSENILCTINVIDFCSKNRIPLIYASSSALYGGLGFGDDASPKVDLLSPYAVDKYTMELYSKTAFQLHKLSSIGLRFFNVYGPKQDPGSPYSGVISIFIDRLLKNQSIKINGGHQTRDFIYVGDVVNSIYNSLIILLNKNICDRVNVLTGKSISIDKLADSLIDITGFNMEKIYQDMSKGDPIESNGTTKKMVDLLGINLNEQITLDIGLKNTINFIKNSKT
jgi:UDP-glucose 4-epimerase